MYTYQTSTMKYCRFLCVKVIPIRTKSSSVCTEYTGLYRNTSITKKFRKAGSIKSKERLIFKAFNVFF